MLETVNQLANVLVEKAPEFLRIAHNEEDRTRDPQPKAAHFLKFNLNGDERRMGRDLELYNFMSEVGGDTLMMSLLLEELVLPLHEYSAAAYSAGLAFMQEHADLIKPDLREQWTTMVKGFQETP